MRAALEQDRIFFFVKKRKQSAIVLSLLFIITKFTNNY